MSLVILGLSHHSAPVELREKLVFSREEIEPLSARLRGLAEVAEWVVLSTCNRTEILAALRNGTAPDAGCLALRDLLCAAGRLEAGALDPYVYAHRDLDAVRHVFRVASSLDSMIVGEPQILGQVKAAYHLAAQNGTMGPRLSELLQHAFAAAKRVRSETAISRNPVSISFAAVDLASRIFGSLSDRSVLVVGAGKMAELAVRHLVAAGARHVFVTSRTFAHAREVAERFRGVPISYDRFRERLALVDIVISSTAAPGHVLREEDGLALMRERRGRPIFIIDIAIPRDVDPSLNRVDNIYLYDLDDLQRCVDAGIEDRRRHAAEAEAIVEEEVARFLGRSRARDAAPLIVALRRRLHDVAEAELCRFRPQLGPLSQGQEAAVREMMKALVNKLLHGPTREVKRAAEDGSGAATIEAARRMFDLGAPSEDEEREAGG